MAKSRLIAINGNAGAFTAVSATSVTRRIEIIEDGSANGGVGQGLQYQYDDESATPFTTIYTILPQTEPLILNEPVPQFDGWGRVIGKPAESIGGINIPATLLCNIRSATATATVIRINEFA